MGSTDINTDEISYHHHPWTLQTTSQSYKDTTLLGVGQGATDASSGWLLISTILSNLYNKVANGYTLYSLDKTLNSHLSQVLFVDDATLIHADQ